MMSLRFQLALAALSLTIPSAAFAAAQVPSVGWFQLPPQQAAPPGMSGTHVPVTSVILETEFVELTETGARNLGLDFNNANGQIGAASVSYSKGFPGFEDTPKFGGVTAAFQVALYAQIAKGEGKIVSKPRIS